MTKSGAFTLTILAALATLFAIGRTGAAEIANFKPVTDAMLANPAPEDWLMFSRTFDAQRFSPLKQIDRRNVGKLTTAWSKVFGAGSTETIPTVYQGVMYLTLPGSDIQAVDAATGEVLWEYKRPFANPNAGRGGRSKTLAIYQDLVFFTSPDSYVVALDAKTGAMRWEAKTDTRGHTTGAFVADGKVISGGACGGNRNNCYIVAHDALTGKEAWRFYTTPAPGEPGDETWAGAALNNRQASTWGLPGSYDPARKLLFWGVANPMPDQRTQRHAGNVDAVPVTTPADLYSNSTVALDPATGKLKWYYQHLPADDWDADFTHERTLVRMRLNPDPRFVKWINPDIQRGEERDVAVTIGEGGGVFVLDRETGKFLWATPFPSDSPNYIISDIDPKTGQVRMNENLLFKAPGEKHTVCYWNTRSYWPTSYNPETNSLYTSFIDNCRELTTAGPAGRGSWRVVPRPEADPNALTGLAKINLTTGEVLRFNVGRSPSNGAVLTTAGGLVFHGDMAGNFRAFDAESGKTLWSTNVTGVVSVSTITYSAGGKQYVAVMTGDNPKVPELLAEFPDMKATRGHNAIYVFALP